MISTPLPEVESIPGEVALAGTADAFGDALERARGRVSVLDRQRRHALAANHSWDVRVEEMSRHIEAFLREKGRG